MDHLLYPLSTNIPPLQIPFLYDGEEEYDNRGFTTYSLRKGWANSTTSLEWLQCSDEDLAKRAQLWLYFGLLSEFCGRVVLKSALRRVNEVTASPELSTVNLLGLIDNRKRGRSKENLEKTRRLLEEALRLSELVEIRITSALGSLHLISCSVRVLLQTLNSAQGLQIQALSSARRYQAGRRWPLKFSAGLFDEWKISPAKAIKYRMADLGWCPAQINDFSRKYSCIMLYYVSGLAMENGVNHAQCTIANCTAYNIDESCYVPRHIESCGGHICSFVDATSATVASIIDDNYGIPLVSCSMSSDGTIRTEIVRAEPNLEYFAISHVWSGGLGNPTSNALPECQVNRLMHRIQCLRGRLSHSFGIGDRLSPENPTLFWIDTICIPVGQSFRSARRKAIDSMAEIYSGATAVLVLDPELQHLRYENLKAEQAVAHVLCSSWMSRCWTLQEASLSSSWFVQFEDSAINVSRTMKQLCMKAKMDFWIARGSLKPSMRRALVEELSNFLIAMGEVRYQRRGRYSRSEIWNLKQLELHQAISFATTWNNFLGRTTSRTEDLHQIWAGMEDINVAGVRALAIEDRMKAILKCHAALPIDLLFCPCERMRDVNLANTWAPRFPQGQRLDGMSGSMKVFTNYLFIPAEVTSKHLRLYFVASKGFSASNFQLDIPKAGSVWIETDMTDMTDPPDPHQHKEIDDSITCLMFQVMDYQPHGQISSEEVGARFLLRKKLGHDVYLTYDRPFRMYRYNRGSVISSNVALLPSTYPCVSAELVEPASRVFIDCGESSSIDFSHQGARDC